MRGQIIVNVPVILIMFGIIVGGWYLVIFKSLLWYWGLISFLIGPLIAWVFWSFMITHWRIWAFSRIEDHRELKDQAIDGMLIWKDGSFFERTEIRTTRQRNIIDELEQRFEDSKIYRKFVDDLSIPDKVEYKYSKSGLIVGILLYSSIIGCGIYLVSIPGVNTLGVFSIIIGIIFLRRTYKEFSNSQLSLILSNQGITTNGELIEWKYISNETAKMKGYGQYRKAYLIFDLSGVNFQIMLADYNIKLSTLRYQLKIFRGRANISANDPTTS